MLLHPAPSRLLLVVVVEFLTALHYVGALSVQSPSDSARLSINVDGSSHFIEYSKQRAANEIVHTSGAISNEQESSLSGAQRVENLQASVSLGADGVAIGIDALGAATDTAQIGSGHKVDRAVVRDAPGVSVDVPSGARAKSRIDAHDPPVTVKSSKASLMRRAEPAKHVTVVADILGILRHAVDKWKEMERRHQSTILIVILCLVISIIVALVQYTFPPSPKLKVTAATYRDTWEFGPADKSMGATASLKTSHILPEECNHHDGVHTYEARGQMLSMCSHCGSRWMLQKSTGTLIPIAPKVIAAET